jgi:hypothetical protein
VKLLDFIEFVILCVAQPARAHLCLPLLQEAPGAKLSFAIGSYVEATTNAHPSKARAALGVVVEDNGDGIPDNPTPYQASSPCPLSSCPTRQAQAAKPRLLGQAVWPGAGLWSSGLPALNSSAPARTQWESANS